MTPVESDEDDVGTNDIEDILNPQNIDNPQFSADEDQEKNSADEDSENQGDEIPESADYPQVPADSGNNPGHLGEDNENFDSSSRAAAGTKMCYTLLDESLFFASYADLYAVRGIPLKDMSLYMWSKLITVIKKPIDDSEEVHQMYYNRFYSLKKKREKH